MTASSDIPAKYQEYWAKNAGGSYVRTPPVTTATPGFASFDQGFPATNMTLGGINPYGQDMNGILRAESQWSQWFQMGGPIKYDATFQGQIGGYPAGALVASAVTVGLFWISTAENNTTDPEGIGATGWVATQAALLPMTGARLGFTNATTLTLAQGGSGYLWVNGINYPVTGAQTISGGSTTASVLNYIYAFISGGNIALQASTTGYTIGSNGIPVKSGDATRTLVGIAQVNGSNQFANADGSRLVASYFQRQLVRSRTQLSTNRTTTSSTFAEIGTGIGEIRNQFVSWASENVQFAVSGSFACSGSAGAATQVGFNSTSSGEQEASALNSGGGGGNVLGPCGINGTKVGLSEGLNYCTVLAASNGGTATWHGANTAATAQVTLTVTLYQ